MCDSRRQIENFHIQLEDREDYVIWNQSANGSFTCQLGERMSKHIFPHRTGHGFGILNSATSSNNSSVWLASQGKLATNNLRKKRKLTDTPNLSVELRTNQ